MQTKTHRNPLTKFNLGFTLVEMLLVAALLGLLAAVAIPKMSQLFEDQKYERAALDVELLNQALSMWRADNPSLDLYNGTDGAVTTQQDDWDAAALTELGDKYTQYGFAFNASGPTGTAEAAYAVIRPYMGQASSKAHLIDLIGEDVWSEHYYDFDTAASQEIFDVRAEPLPSL
jgi:prepilin-type N-terminal cleavage/methylation domain-containing protein